MSRLLDLIAAFSRLRVAVIGDFLADEFIYGRVARVSREAPVLILEYDGTEVVAGGAGNAANNVAALGPRSLAAGIVGRDAVGARLVKSLHPGVSRTAIVKLADHLTPTKTRILAGGVHSAKQQVVRIDRETRRGASPAVRKRFGQAVESVINGCDAVLFSDYGQGLVTPELVTRVAKRVSKRRGRVPVLIDSRYDLDAYRGLTASTPNESEVEHLLKITIDEDLDVLERAGRALLETTSMEAVLITRGSRGMALFQPGRSTIHIPISGSDEIADVTGAGDTVIATMTVALAAGATFEEAARLANYAGGLVVMKRGTATVSAEELRDAVSSTEASASG